MHTTNRPFRVVFISYRSTLQADALKLAAKKLQNSLAVEGELPEDGLAACGDDDDLLMALARKIVCGERDEAETVEKVFAQTKDAESEAEELLVDKDWRPVEVNGNGHGANGNGRFDALGPTVELVPVNGHNGNGHHGHADEPRQSLFSWVEFIAAEPERPRGRRSRPQPPQCPYSSGRSNRSGSVRPRPSWPERDPSRQKYRGSRRA